MKRYLVRASAIVLAAACKSSQPTAPETPAPAPPAVRTPGNVFGRVIDLSTNTTVPAVELRWSVAGVGAATTVFSDAGGNYNVTLPAADLYLVQNSTLNISGQIRLSDAPVPSDIFINSQACPLRYGVVIDAVTKRPVSGAHIEWLGTADSDTNGSYSIGVECRAKSNSAGTTAIRVTHPSYQDSLTLDIRAETAFIHAGESRRDIALTPR